MREWNLFPVEFIPSRVARALFRSFRSYFGQPLCMSVCPPVRPRFQPFRRSRARESPARPQTANQSLTTAARCRGWARMRAGNGRTRFKTHLKLEIYGNFIFDPLSVKDEIAVNCKQSKKLSCSTFLTFLDIIWLKS